jgi:hypothetical protein
MLATALSPLITIYNMRKRSCVKLQFDKNCRSINNCFINFQSVYRPIQIHKDFQCLKLSNDCINFETEDTEVTEKGIMKHYQYLPITCQSL